MVVKNVTGYDLPRLYHGSLGTLGVILSANFKVLPLPRAEATVLRPAATLADALASAARIRASRVQPAALEVAWLGGRWLAAARLAGREETVAMLAAEARALMADETDLLDGRASADWWTRYIAAQELIVADREVLLRCAVRPRATADLTEAVVATAGDAGTDLIYLGASVGLGTVVVRLRFPEERSGAEALFAWRERLLALADYVVVLAAPAPWKRDLDVWGRPPETLDVMRALKAQFDPNRVLNPGRFAGRI